MQTLLIRRVVYSLSLTVTLLSWAAARPAAVSAAVPGCGYATVWDCTLPDGSHKIVGGTVCDIRRYEQQTGATCVVYGL